jgi:hypothetical protein
MKPLAPAGRIAPGRRWPLAALAVLLSAAGCDRSSLLAVAGDTDASTETSADSDTDTFPSVDSDTEGAAIEMDCSGCDGVGGTLDEMLCAIDLCEQQWVVGAVYSSLRPLVGEADTDGGDGCVREDTYEAVARFGGAGNDLAPKLNGSYALMSTGLAAPSDNYLACWDPYSTAPEYDPNTDELCDDGVGGHVPCPIWDAMEWRIVLEAPPGAKSFRFKYVFFSAEYDEYISAKFNDKFYVFIEAPSTNDGARTIINFTECRDRDVKYDFVCGAEHYYCTIGEKYCFVAVNSAFSECCWYPNGSSHAPNPGDPPCPDGFATTDIAGTGFSCAVGSSTDSSSTGSSTGWLQTSWPIDGGETFALTFHIHDSYDPYFDSEVLIDAFEFLTTADRGTRVVIE